MGGLIERGRSMLRDKWLGLVLGMWMQACGGISYAFSLYSADIKHQLAYNQESIDGLGTSKDIGGNVGIVSGLLIDVVPPWVILLVGAIMHISGYSMLYLAATGQMQPPFWQMCAFIMLGTNGATWFNTAVLVTCIRNFPGDRGVVVGLLKGFIGLSGAIFTQVYTAVYAPHTGPFLFMCAMTPPVVALVSMLIIRPVEVSSRSDPNDKGRFTFLYVVGVTLAFYLMAVILVQEIFSVGKGISYAFMVLMLCILLLPAFVPWSASQSRNQYSPLPTAEYPTPGPEEVSLERSGSVSTPPPAVQGVLDSPSSMSANKLRAPKLGQDHTLLQAVCCQDYWLLFIAMGCGTGSGLTAINNLGQMAESLGSDSVGAFVSLVSVWNFLGRMGAGYISESYVKKYGTPRPLFMLQVQAAMGCAHLLFASAMPGTLYVGSALVGLAHGAHWTLMVATASELFGLRHFGALYNTLSISATVGSYCLSVKLAGYIYDRQVAAERAVALAAGLDLPSGGHHRCVGAKCFRPTFIIMAAICALGSLILLRLVVRTRKLYQVALQP